MCMQEKAVYRPKIYRKSSSYYVVVSGSIEEANRLLAGSGYIISYCSSVDWSISYRIVSRETPPPSACAIPQHATQLPGLSKNIIPTATATHTQG